MIKQFNRNSTIYVTDLQINILNIFFRLLRILESGLLLRIKRKWLTGSTRCTGLERVAAQTNISLREAQGAFYILAIGLVASVLVLVVENLSKSRCWTYTPGFFPPPSMGPPPSTTGPIWEGSSRSMFTGGIRQFPVSLELATVDMPYNGRNDREITRDVSVEGRKSMSEVHQNGRIPNGTAHHQAEVVIHADDILSYVDIFSGEVKRSNLVYQRKYMNQSKPTELVTRSSISDRDATNVTRRRLSSKLSDTSSFVANGSVIRDKNDAETGEIIMEAVSEVSYL